MNISKIYELMANWKFWSILNIIVRITHDSSFIIIQKYLLYFIYEDNELALSDKTAS